MKPREYSKLRGSLKPSDHLWLLGYILLMICTRDHILWLLSDYSWGFSFANGLISIFSVYMIHKASKLRREGI